jgi:hypothetical protein
MDREAADSTGRADDEQRVALRQFQRVDCEHGSDAGHGCGADGREVNTRRNGRDGDVIWDGDQFGPATVADGRVGFEDEAENLVADGVPGDLWADLLDDARRSRGRG